MICCKVQMISGGSAGEADKTKSWVLGIALKKKQILYSILWHPTDENNYLRKSVQKYKGERTSKTVYCTAFCTRGSELDLQ